MSMWPLNPKPKALNPNLTGEQVGVRHIRDNVDVKPGEHMFKDVNRYIGTEQGDPAVPKRLLVRGHVGEINRGGRGLFPLFG